MDNESKYEVEPSVIYANDNVAIVNNDNNGYHGDNYHSNGHVTSNGEAPPQQNNDRDTLQRTLGYRQGFVLLIGLILGSGVFVSPSLVAKVCVCVPFHKN